MWRHLVRVWHADCRMASRRKLKLLTEDSKKIKNMFVKVGKIGGLRNCESNNKQ